MDFFSFRETLNEAKGQGAKAKANIAKLRAGDKVYIEMIVGNQNKPMKMDAEIVSVDASKTPSKAVKAKINKVDGRTVFNAKTEYLSANDLAHITKINGKSMKESLDESILSERVLIAKGRNETTLEIGKRGAKPDYKIVLNRQDLAKIKALKSTDDPYEVGYKFKDKKGKQVSVSYTNKYLDFTVGKDEDKSFRIERSSLFGHMNEAAVSKQQQKLFALALAYRKGEVPADEVSDTVKKMAKDVSMKELEKFAGTKHKGLPDKVDEDKRKGLPAHLRKHFDKNGDPVKKGFKFKKAKDVTPKGYGPDESMDEKMDPTKHVSKDGDEYVVVDKNGEEVKRFKDKDTADKYAIDNHDALMES